MGTIQVFNSFGATGTTVDILDASRFVPGVGDEQGGNNEIEIFVSLQDQPGSILRVTDDDDSGASIRFGSGGINPNAFAFEQLPDADIFPSGVPEGALHGYGGAGPDTFGAQGGAGTGAALVAPVFFIGDGGFDSVTGGAGGDVLVGNEGGDALSGGGGDVAIAGPQDTGGSGRDSLAGVENAFGTRYPDVLRGDGGPNVLLGDSGPDILDGRSGEDVLDGGAGADALDVRDGGPDTADCGTDTDAVSADRPGIDSLIKCEHPLFPVVPPSGGGGSGPAASPDTLAPAFVGRVRAVPKRFRFRRATAFRYSLSEAATVTFTIERRTAGRRAEGSCRAKTRSNARKPRCTRFVRVASFAAPAAAGANRTPFPGRLKPSAYRAVLTARDAAGNTSRHATADFQVVRRRKHA